MLINDLEYFKRRANYCGATSGMDQTRQNNYSFNSWGFRGPEYEQHIGKPVNVCLGDSFTVNVGGPIEHSWCSQLALHFDIPTLNLGMDGAGNDAIRLVYNRACDLFDVQNTFVMYSYLHRRLVDSEFTQQGYSHSENCEYFLQHRIITTAYESVLPYWTHTQQELDFLTHNNLFFFGMHNETVIDQKKYEYVSGPDWPTYEEYINGITADQPEIVEEMKLFDQENFYHDYKKKFTNSDGYHMNQDTNKVYADYFLNQCEEVFCL